MNGIYDVDWLAEGPVRAAVHKVVEALRRGGWAPAGPSAGTFEGRFAQLQGCEVPATAFTPAMCCLFYELGHCLRPRQLVGVGTYCGTALNLLAAGAADGIGPGVEALGLDLDGAATALARRNAARMGLGHVAEYRQADGMDYLASRRNRPPIDLLYLDLDHPREGKAGYARAFGLAWRCLADRAFVLAHDALVPKFRRDLLQLRKRVLAAGFGLILDIPIDRAGLFVAARRDLGNS